MFDAEKLEAIREYLRINFNTSEITDREDFDRVGQTFRIVESNKIYTVTVAGEFIEDNDASAISIILRRHNLKSFFENEKVRELFFTSYGGITVEY
jgi:hypothetical protein